MKKLFIEKAKEITKQVAENISKKFSILSDEETQYNNKIRTQISQLYFPFTIALNLFNNSKNIKGEIIKRLKLLIIPDFLEHLKDNLNCKIKLEK